MMRKRILQDILWCMFHLFLVISRGILLYKDCNEEKVIGCEIVPNYLTTGLVLYYLKAAVETVVAGLKKKARILQPEELKRTAYHEAGHVVTGWFLQFANPLHKVSIIPHGRGLGYTMYVPEEKYLFTKEALLDKMCVCLGGRSSELVFFGDLSTGAQDDLQKVTQTAYDLIMHHGMSDKVGHLSFSRSSTMKIPLGGTTLNLIDDEARNLVHSAMDRTLNLLTEKKKEVEELALLLLDKKTLERDDVANVLGERTFWGK